MDYKKLLEIQKDYVINLRRYFHKNPELSWKEFETSRRIKSELENMGIPYIEMAGTGVVATIKGKPTGKIVALRGDIDALEVTEKNEIEYKSQNPKVMHACGHDGHAAMLLGAARALNEIKENIRGTIKLIFQPAEEMVQGAKEMIEEGALEGVDGILGIHLWSGIETGKISVDPGPRMASGDHVKIDIIGKGGHGSMPHQGIDAVVAASSLVMNTQSIMSREVNPLDTVVFTIGEIQSGTRFNVIGGEAHIEGTVRCFDPKTRAILPEIIKRHADNTAKAYRAKAKVQYIEGTPPTINDEKCSSIAEGTVLSMLGEDGLLKMEKTTGSEDMAYYLEKIPGLIAFVGAGNPEKGADFPHHHPRFNIDEDSLAIGTELYFRFAIDFLEKF
ncbi:M20 family metallopeptidase [Maledivibacter halophilus]|uniref:Amidohydrolase n=1 Tax=Maledivibacter halophilus TaxID=36842 RepID=A0A1T5LZV2_9FIRM|nr:M20 family metallopeptidase [Maledivibacter halophilus]SKC81324.1 amidohydrolase [Maledivibacter halophilus]